MLSVQLDDVELMEMSLRTKIALMYCLCEDRIMAICMSEISGLCPGHCGFL